jgi:hypothetical protein
MRRIATIAVAGVLVVSLSGCAGASNPSVDSSASDVKTNMESTSTRDAGISDEYAIDKDLSASIEVQDVTTSKTYIFSVPLMYSNTVGVNEDQSIRFTFQCTYPSGTDNSVSSASEVFTTFSNKVLLYASKRGLAPKEIIIDKTENVTINGRDMSRVEGALHADDMDTLFVGYATLVDGNIVWFTTVDYSSENDKTHDELGEWADRVAQTMRVKD